MLKDEDILKIVNKHVDRVEELPKLVKKLSGLTNLMYRVDIDSRPSVILRKFNGDMNRKAENQIFMVLSSISKSPNCIYACEEYRLEEFVSNSRHFSLEQLVDEKVLCELLKEIHTLHCVVIEQAKKLPNLAEEVFSQHTYEIVRAYQPKKKTQKMDQLKKTLLTILSDFPWWKDLLLPKGQGRLTFCHNDLNAYNIFVNTLTDKITFIDFEYACYNYPEYDVANFLNETCIDYSVEEYPKFKLTKRFTKEDLGRLCKLYPGYTPGMEKSVLKFLLVANMFWAVWCLKMSGQPSHSQFGTYEHGLMRIDLFRYYKSLLEQQ